MSKSEENNDWFWSKVDIAGKDECWKWLGSYNRDGYGQIGKQDESGSRGAHRVAYELVKGPIPFGLIIDHRCKNRWCVNPSHLDAVTDYTNFARSRGLQEAKFVELQKSSSGIILKFSEARAVRILTPIEFETLREVGDKIKLDSLLFSSTRYVEHLRLHENPGWFVSERRRIHLPPMAILKGERKQLDRWIPLNERGACSIHEYLEGRTLPSWGGWSANLRNWALKSGVDPRCLGPKTLRKTYESWLVKCYPERLAEILLRQGHTSITAVGHYLNLPFNDEEKAQMLPYVEGVF